MKDDSMYSTPTGLLLDFGSVITYSLFEKHHDTEAILGLPAGSLTWLGPLDPRTDDLWRDMQADRISERDYWARRAAQLGQACGEPGWDMLQLLKRVRHTEPNAAIRPQMRTLVQWAADAGVKVGILSNELELFYGSQFLARLDIMKDIAVIIDGSHSKVLKPDPKAYQAAADAMGMAPAQLLFVDDQMRNIVGAHQIGMQTQLFELRDPDGSAGAVLRRLRIDRTS
jgi:putative hydrolase of the HAD superfamily